MISYRLVFESDDQLVFDVDEESDTSAELSGEQYPEWVRLDQHTCPECSLPLRSRVTCPAALAILPVVEAIGPRASYEEVLVYVNVADVELKATVPVQRALRSIVGLLLALSSCPVLAQLRPMARIHLPFSRRHHTVFRFVGMYLIAQYLRSLRGLTSERKLKGLLRLFDDLHEVNIALADRIRSAVELDAAVNSLILLDTFALDVEMDVERELEDLAGLFETWLDEPEARVRLGG